MPWKQRIAMCVMAVLTACGKAPSVEAIASSPATYAGKTVTVVGVVEDMGHGAYVVSDGGGHEIYLRNVNWEGKVPARNGETAKLTGISDPDAMVKNSMHIIQTVLEVWSIDHNGHYPTATASWKASDGKEIGILAYLPGGDPIGTDGTPVAGRFPINPFSGKQYEFGKDLYFFPDTLKAYGDNGILRATDKCCPFVGFSAPGGSPGTIVILGHADEHGAVEEYSIIGFGKQTNEPMYDMETTSKEGVPESKLYFVLHN